MSLRDREVGTEVLGGRNGRDSHNLTVVLGEKLSSLGRRETSLGIGGNIWGGL